MLGGADDDKNKTPRRFSEVTRFRAPTMPTGTLIDFSDTSHSRTDILSKHKKNVDSIVASDMSGGIKTYLKETIERFIVALNIILELVFSFNATALQFTCLTSKYFLKRG